jgi:radical SAM/Cys-rich protein
MGVCGVTGPGGRVTPFAALLGERGLTLTRGVTSTLQVNVGLVCNQHCRHCHQGAGPDRPERMSRETAERVVELASRFPFLTADITGGAPEMVSSLPFLLEGLASRVPRVMLRTNLTALAGCDRGGLPDLLRRLGIVLIASLPSLDEAETDAQRGRGTFRETIRMLRALNEAGYGREGTGLELNLVANPTGESLPAPQDEAERRFRHRLAQGHGIVFSHLYTLVNVPLGRHLAWLRRTGAHEAYLGLLASRFNPATLPGLMCRTTLSVAWDGGCFDCDFNLARNLPLGGRPTQVADLEALPPPGSPIALADHCYACTAETGFT